MYPCISVSRYLCIPVSLYSCILVFLYPCINAISIGSETHDWILLGSGANVIAYKYVFSISVSQKIHVSLHPCTSISCISCIPVFLYLCFSVSLFSCISVSLYLCIPVSLYPCIPVSLYPCIQERMEEVNYWFDLLMKVRKKMDSHSLAKNAKTMDR